MVGWTSRAAQKFGVVREAFTGKKHGMCPRPRPLMAFGATICVVLLASIVVLRAQLTPATSPQPSSPASRPTTPPPPPGPANPADERLLAELGKRPNRVHDPSTIVHAKDGYWLFYTGRGVRSLHSRDLITWEAGPPVFAVRPAWTLTAVPENRGGDQGDYWAPDIIELNGRYLLYYSVSTFGKRVSAIGLATNTTLDPFDAAYKWVDQGPVIQSTTADNFNTIDPAVTVDAQGRLWLAFGSFWSGIKLIQLDPATGKRLAPDSPIHALAHFKSIEASFIYFHDGYYYLFVNWGTCCRGVDSTYEIRIGRSREITGPYRDKAGVDLREDGGSPFLSTEGPFIGPGHAGILHEGGRYWLSLHYYDGTQRGMSNLAIRPLQWDADGWPVAGRVAVSSASAKNPVTPANRTQ